ncbi:MAG: hypothetical protein LQ340_001136 [Diploschistes diacapsis]|nr:MAG: hypothetical protein LQ340_001136 [Diploschistes diacapsis]
MIPLLVLPIEIRLDIYSYLLEDTKVTEMDQGIGHQKHHEWLRPNYCTALFTVNKQLSKESLEFFYMKNSFISFNFQESYLAYTAYRLFAAVRLQPTLQGGKGPKSENLLATITLQEQYRQARTLFNSEQYQLVFSVKHLETFATILNLSTRCAGLAAPNRKSVYCFHCSYSNSGPYSLRRRGRPAMKTFLDGMKTLKGQRVPGSPASDPNPSHQYFSEDEVQSIMNAPPRLTTIESILAEGKHVLTQAQGMCAAGFRHLADSWYLLALDLVLKVPLQQRGRRSVVKFQADVWKQKGWNNVLRGQFVLARMDLGDTIQLYRTRIRNEISMVDLGDLYLVYAQACIETKFLKAAQRAIDDAELLLPSCEIELQKQALEEAKERRNGAQRGQDIATSHPQ